MSGIDLGDEDGFIAVRFGDVEVQLDLYEVNNEIYELQKRHESQTTAFAQGVVDLLKAKGLPQVSHRVADRFAGEVFRLIDEMRAAVKKKDECSASISPTPSSPVGTEPVFLPSPPATN